MYQLAREGDAKNVPPTQLLGALQAELRRLRTAAAILNEVQGPVDQRTRERFLATTSILLQQGLPRDVIATTLEATPVNGDIGRSMRVVSLLSEIDHLYGERTEDLSDLGSVLSQSSLSAGQLETLPALYLNYMNAGLSVRTIHDVLIRHLSRGAGFLEIERALRLRSRRR